MDQIVEVHLDLRNANKQLVKVEIKWKPKSNLQRILLPTWTPGSYTIRDHSQNIYNISIEQLGQNIELTRENTSEWSFKSLGNDYAKLSYEVQATNLTVRTCYIDNKFASLCLPALIMLVSEQRDNKHTLELDLPENWASYVPLKGEKIISAIDYDELIDAPIHAGLLPRMTFTIGSIPHELIIVGEHPDCLPETFIDDVKKICKAVCKIHDVQEPIAKSFQIVIQLIEDLYGGLEHDNSFVIQYSWREIIDPKGYRKFLQLIAHEYLHQWNIRRLRPVEYIRYDYTRPIISDSLWFAEGITSYFDLVIPYIAFITNYESILEDLSKEINLYLNTPGRYCQSLADSSREAWVKLYKSTPSSINNQISYYRLGTLLAFCLDVELRTLDSSLSRLLREMFANKELLITGYSRTDILKRLEEIDSTLPSKLNIWLDTTASIPLIECLNKLGLDLESKPKHPFFLGLKVKNELNSILIKSVISDSPAAIAGLITNDELIAIDNFRVKRQEDLYLLFKAGTESTIIYCRRGNLYECKIIPSFDKEKEWFIVANTTTAKSEEELLRKWLDFV